MKKIFGLLAALLSSCSLDRLIAENTEMIRQSKEAIEENTHQIKRSTDTMMQFEFIFPIVSAIVALIAIVLFVKFFRKIYKLITERRRK